jgi:FlaG/FlaF family flagellin (archaellin)
MFCQKCGAKNDEDASFCNSCGTPLNQSGQVSPPKKHGILFWIAVVIGIFIVVIIAAAIVAAFVFGMASSVNQNSPIATIAPVTAPSLDVSAKVPSTWIQYTSNSDKFGIFTPNDWTVKEIPVSTATSYSANKMDTTNFLPNVIYIYSPSDTGFITIYGADFSGTLYSIFSDQSKTQISDEFYDGAINGVESAGTWESKDGTIQMNVTSVERDINQYTINGNPARRMILNFLANGQPLSGDCYIIAHGNTYYIEFYSAMVGSSQEDASNSVGIMQSLTTINS